MFLGHESIGFLWSGVGRVRMQFLRPLVVSAVMVFLATIPTPWYPLEVGEVGML